MSADASGSRIAGKERDAMVSLSTQYVALLGESVSDAFRRRIVAVVCVVGLLMLAMANGCTSCQADMTLQVQGPDNVGGLAGVLGYAGFGAFAMLAAWVVVLAGILAADQLTQPVEDGSAVLILARPVDRRVFALARLSGSLVVSLGVGGVVLIGTSILIATRSDLSFAPAIPAVLLTLLNGVTSAALSMWASFRLPRVAVFLCVMAGVGFLGIAQLAAMSEGTLGTSYALLAYWGPPVISALEVSLAPWWSEAFGADATALVWLRAGLWALLSSAGLAASFHRRELSG